MLVTIDELAARVNGTVWGAGEVSVADVASLGCAASDKISYLESRKQLKQLLSALAGCVLTTLSLAEEARKLGIDCPLIVVEDPQSAFIEIMLFFRPLPEKPAIGISAQAFISDSASIGENCQIFPHAYLGENVKLGNNCQIGPGAVIEDGCLLGDGCIVHANAVLYRDVVLGERVIVHANAVIGADGFGYRFVEGCFERIPHTGTVIIESDVEIGACTTIDRGMIESTVIGQGTKLDNQVMIAHNCRVGKHNAYASQVGMAGSCTTGDYVQMGGQAGVADHVTIGNGVKCGAKSGVVADLPERGTYHGAPAIPEKDALRNHFLIQRLPQLRQQVKDLTEQLTALQAQLHNEHAPDSQRELA